MKSISSPETGQAVSEASTPKQALRDVAQEVGCSLTDLLVLSFANDPFNCGSKGDLAIGAWFAELFRAQGFERGVHLRRVHYRLVSLTGIVMHDGRPYENTDRCWQYLVDASKAARYLGLVDAADFVDHRNPAPKIYAPNPEEQEDGEWWIGDMLDWSLPEINTALTVEVDCADIRVRGYDWTPAHEPYHLECWIEKNTMNDVLEPICSQYGVNLVPGLGFQSITATINLLGRIRRVLAMGRPVRIFYISDFDPAGDCMPVAIARQLQFWMEKYGHVGDVKLTPLALTRAQVDEYDLPRKPIKESDRRRESFENRRGDGAVELDALEAIVPGELGRFFEEAVARYRDGSLRDRMGDADYEARTTAAEEWGEATEDIRERVEEFRAEAQRVLKPYERKLKRLAASMDKDLAPLRERMEALEKTAAQEFNEARDAFSVELPDVPEPEIDPGDEDDWLFDSTRPYMEQLDVFRKHQKG